jgi:hypothetical protein
MRKIHACALCVTVLCGGCSSIENAGTNSVLIPNEQINISRSLSITLESIAAGAVIYIVIDPLAPNWRIEQTQLDGGRYLIAMKKKRFTTGGDGEAAQIFFRRAAQLAQEQGNGTYRVVEYSEGIESSVPIAQRVARGILELEGRQPAASPRSATNTVSKAQNSTEPPVAPKRRTPVATAR